MIPSEYGRVCEFNRPSAITRVTQNTFDAYYDEETGQQVEGPVTIKRVYIITGSGQSEFDVESEGYSFTWDGMGSFASGSMIQPLYRIIQKDVILTADTNTGFILAYNSGINSISEALSQWTANGYNSFYVMGVELTGNHIDQAKDTAKNYIG